MHNRQPKWWPHKREGQDLQPLWPGIILQIAQVRGPSFGGGNSPDDIIHHIDCRLFKKSSFRGLDPVKEASKPKKPEVAASSDLHDLYDMISRVGDSRLDEQRSPAPSSMYGSPAPQSSTTTPLATVPRYVLTTSTPQDQHLSHRGNCDQQPDHRGDKVSPLGLSQMATPGRVHVGSGPTSRWADVEVGTTSCSSISEVTGGRGEEEEGEEPGDAGVPAAAKAGDSLELDLSVSSGSGSHPGLTSWVQFREDEGAAQPHPLPPPPPPTGPSTYPPHHHTSLTSDDPHNKSGSSAHLPHPLESQQRRQSKRESWYSDVWDDSNALSFSASLGFEPSSFGKKDHRRFSMSFVDQGSEGAEL